MIQIRAFFEPDECVVAWKVYLVLCEYHFVFHVLG